MKKQVIITPPIHAMSKSWFVYLNTVLILSWLLVASISACLGDDVGLLADSFFLTGLGLLETLRVLLRVGAVELNFCKSTSEVAFSKFAFSILTNVTAMLSSLGEEGGDGIWVEVGVRQERSIEIYGRCEKAMSPGC